MNSSTQLNLQSTPRSSRLGRRPGSGPAGRTALAAVAGLALTFGLTACGGDDADPSSDDVRTASDGSEFNQADVDFATRMIPHHAQAVQMVVMAQGRELDPEVASLMEDIRDAQVPEIETMSDWLVTWGEPVPETSLDHANAGHDGDGHGGDEMDMSEMDDMPGMMDDEQMDGLDRTQGSAFQEMWIEMMTEHHEGAIEMAEAEVEDGHNPEAIAMAEQIIESQTAEIETMQGL